MINKKAIIVTFHCCPNYGAVLQTYGLYLYLKTLFQDVEVLDYRPPHLMNEYKYISTYSLGSIVTSFWALPTYWKKRRHFSEFLKNVRITKCICNSVEAMKPVDAQYCFVGSDQIWNPEITKGLDKVYFGQIPHIGSFTVVSYGASLGKGDFSQEELESLKDLLSGVSAISVREESAKVMLEEKLNIKADVVLDPTLLAGEKSFKKFLQKNQKGDYLFVYTLNQDPEKSVRSLARQISKEKKIKIIEIYGNRKGFRHVDHEVIYDAGPVEFVSLLANAKYVVTDSFHGTAFSLLFHRQFVTIPHKTRGGRMVSLLSAVGLEQRLVMSNSTTQIDDIIDWNDVDHRLNLARKHSEEFIRKSISYL